MSEKTQIIFMQVRLLRLASQVWKHSISETVDIFSRNGVLEYIRECFGMFHAEGDEAVLEEIQTMLEHKGVKYCV